MPADAPAVAAARERGVAVIGELELAWRLLPNRFVAVTGTNGKTTVTELLGHVWRTAGEPVAVAGNVGTPLASLVGELDAEATVVCECSSFQLEDTEAFAPECAVLLNASPDHLDRHRDFDDYLRAKLRIFANQGNDDAAIFNASEEVLRGLDLGGCGRRIAYCRGVDPDCEVALADGVIFADGEPLLRAAELELLGPHNAENAMAAAAAALAMALDRESIRRCAANLPRRRPPARAGRRARRRPLRQRLEGHQRCRAAAAALRSFEGGVRAILGGSLKGGDFEGLVDPVAERCRACYLIGDAAEQLAAELRPAAEHGVEAPPMRRTSPTRWPRRRRERAARGRWSCSRPPAPASTPTVTSRSAASTFGPSSGASKRADWGRTRLQGRIPCSDSALTSRLGPRTRKRAGAQPIEYNLLLTATLCLLAFGVVMVFSASSTTALLGQSGDSAYYLKRTVLIGAIGLA